MLHHTTDPAERAYDVAKRINDDLWKKYGPYGTVTIDYNQLLLELAGVPNGYQETDCDGQAEIARNETRG